MRFLNPGPPGVLKAILDGREATPTEMLDQVQPSVEARALRSWEFFHERIVPLQANLTLPGVAGVFGGALIGPPTLPDRRYANGILVIESIFNAGGQNLSVRVGTTSAFVASTGAFFSSDSRWGGLQSFLSVPDTRLAALDGTEVFFVTPFTSTPPGWYYVMQFDQYGALPYTLGLMTTVVATPGLIQVIGKFIGYRIRGQ